MPLLVAAIDFGTTYSGWAFSFKHDFEQDPIKVSAKQWLGGQLVSLKGPTCALINGDGKTLEAFGYEAESKYADYASENCHKEYYFFERFKMKLYGRIGIERNIHIEDASGKKLKAKTVFALSIKYLKDDLIKTWEGQVTDFDFTNDDIRWVLTVPAIWNDAAKQFMREAAEEAGIDSDKLTIALEPEAASLYCRHLPIDMASESLGKLKSGSQYIVVDAGGGTVDVTVHEVTFDGTLKELHKATGGDWGGTKVDEAFKGFLNNIHVSECDVTEKMKQHYMEDYIDLFRDFELTKRGIKSNQASKISLRIPSSFVSIVEEKTKLTLNEQIDKTVFNGSVKLERDKLKVDARVAQELFKDPISSITRHIQSLLKEPKMRGCSTILLVGGFSESSMLQERVREIFPNKKVIVPRDAGLAVLKGAVIYGHSPTAISERVLKTTYGKKESHKKSSKCKHPPCRVDTDKNGDIRCREMFRCIVEEGTSVKLGERLPEQRWKPIHDDQSKIGFELYASTSPDAHSITEQSCTKIGKLIIDIPDRSLGRKRSFGSCLMFGDTEIKVMVEDKATGKVTEKLMDFLG